MKFKAFGQKLCCLEVHELSAIHGEVQPPGLDEGATNCIDAVLVSTGWFEHAGLCSDHVQCQTAHLQGSTVQ